MLLRMKKGRKKRLKNRRNFIGQLGPEMEKGIDVKHSLGDADYDIAISAYTIALLL